MVHDVDDPLVPVREAQQLADAWGVGLTTTSELGHHRILMDDTVVASVVTFLTGALRIGS